jgi:hypothetical protein
MDNAENAAGSRSNEIKRLAEELSNVNGTELGAGLDALKLALKRSVLEFGQKPRSLRTRDSGIDWHASPQFVTAVEAARSEMQAAKDKMEGLISDLELAVSPVNQDSVSLIAERLHKQYSRLLQVASVVHTIRNVVDSKDNEGQDDDMVAIFDSLCVVEEMLTDIAEQMEPPFMLAREVAHG